MRIGRIVACVLSLVLLALLGWSIFAGVGDLLTWVTLGVGVALGVLYAVYGRLPDWIVEHSDGSITADDDPSNIPPRVYLPILLVAILLALTAFAVAVW